MELPIRILTQAPEYSAVVVDGAFDSPPPTLHLSHWPGNHTPAFLKHDLSSGIALAFVQLPNDLQQRLRADAEAWVNSHYDTDGTLALFALSKPRLALQHRQVILDAAAAGDFFRWPTDQALALDAIVTGLSQSELSPLARELEGLVETQRWQRCSEHLMEVLPTLLEGDIAPYAALWEPILERAKLDAKQLEQCSTQRLPELGLQLWRSSSDEADPGRHALFQASPMEGALVLSETPKGCRMRLVESTLTWFELASRSPRERPDLVALAAELNQREPNAGPDRWQAQPRENPSPELWFGSQQQAAFAEHNPSQGWSGLPSDEILACVQRCFGSDSA